MGKKGKEVSEDEKGKDNEKEGEKEGKKEETKGKKGKKTT